MRNGEFKSSGVNRPAASSQLLVRAGQWEFAIPSRLVTSIVPAPSILPIPGVPEWMAGLLHSGGTATAVLDVRARLGMGSGQGTSAVVVIAHPGEENGQPKSVGLLVDKILDTASIRSSEIHPMKESSTLPFREYLIGAWRGRSRACYLLDVGKLVPQEFEAQMQAIFSSFR